MFDLIWIGGAEDEAGSSNSCQEKTGTRKHILQVSTYQMVSTVFLGSSCFCLLFISVI